VNDRGFTFDESALTGELVTTYVFTSDVVRDTENWQITGFQAFQAAGGSLSNLSILDVSDLGVNGLADLVIVQDGLNAVITSNEGLDFEIILVGVDSTQLSNENFDFT